MGDIRIAGIPIRTGSQIADFIKIRLSGICCRIGRSRGAPVDGCVRYGAAFAATGAGLPSRRAR